LDAVARRSESPAAFWALDFREALERCGGSERGLSSAEAAARLQRWGPNELQPPGRFEALGEIGRYLLNPLVLILLVASGVSAAFGQAVSSIIIAVMVLLSVALNFTQAYRSRQAALALRARVGQTTSVIRDGTTRDVPAREVVPGDLVRLAAGDLVPADARLLSAKDLFINEAALTGESLPREKHAGRGGAPSASLLEAENAVFRGTSVVSGVGAAVVIATGRDTELAASPPCWQRARPRPNSNEVRVASGF
jgi:Mg2+-importing ATPase